MSTLIYKNTNNYSTKYVAYGPITLNKIIYIIVLILTCALIGTAIATVNYTKADYNKIPSLRNSILSFYNTESSVILDRNGKVLFDYRSKTKKEQLNQTDIPDLVKYSILVREDENYFNTGGFSWKNFTGALIGCFKSKVTLDPSDCRGGSGIFQQLVKNFDKPDNRDFDTKYNELLRSLKASEEISLDEALAMYLNNMDFGRVSKGVEMGSKAFFGHSVNDISFNPAKACFLAIMPNQPTGFTTAVRNKILGTGEEDSRDSYKWSYAKYLIDDCLNKLSTVKIISHKPTIITPLEVDKWKKYDIIADVKKELYDPNDQAKYYIRDYIEEELLTKFKDQFKDRQDLEKQLYNDNLRITTTFDIDIQNKMEKSLLSSKEYLKNQNINQFSSAVVNNQNSELLAMQGNINYGESQINRLAGEYGYILPGSSTKPYFFAAAFDRGFNPATILHDINYIDPVIGNVRSNDVVGKYQGYISMRYGLQQSINTIAEQALYINQDGNDFAFKTGVKNSVEFARNLGIKYQEGNNACLEKIDVAVGACPIYGLSHLNAFSTLANQGLYNEIRPIIEVKSKTKSILTSEQIKTKYITNKQTASPEISNQIMNVTSDYKTRRDSAGSRSEDAPNYEINGFDGDNSIAAKSGTAQIYYDGKNQNGEITMIGGSKEISTLIWAGNSNEKNIKQPIKSGSSAITPIFKDMMTKFHEGKTPSGFSKTGLIQVKVDPITGILNETGTNELMTQKQIDILKNFKTDPNGTIFTNRTSAVRDNNCIKALRIVDHFRFEEARDNIQTKFGGNSCIPQNSKQPTASNKYKVEINNLNTKIKKTDKISFTTNIEDSKASLNIQLIGPQSYNLMFYSNTNSFTMDTMKQGAYKMIISATDSNGTYTLKEQSFELI